MNKTQIQRFDTYIQVAEQIMQHKNIKKKKISMREYDSIEKRHSYYID